MVSYSDSESATLTATLANGGTPLVGETISFYANDTLLGTSITNNNGEATYTYDSEGVGDIDIQADWNSRIQSEIFVLEDCYDYDTMTSNHNKWDIDSNYSFSENGILVPLLQHNTYHI